MLIIIIVFMMMIMVLLMIVVIMIGEQFDSCANCSEQTDDEYMYMTGILQVSSGKKLYRRYLINCLRVYVYLQ